MRRTRFAVVALTVLGSVGIGGISSRAEDAPPVAKPTSHHKLLAKDAGTWDATMRAWCAGPDSEPMVSKGVETNTMLGGFWLVSEFRGDFAGQPYAGHGQLGYDTHKGKYVGTWVDSMSTEVMVMEGDLDEKTQTLTTTSKGICPLGKPYEAKLVTEHKGDDTRVFTMFMKSSDTKDEYVKAMEITYKRRAK